MNHGYTITKVGYGFTVECGELFAPELSHGEVLEVIAFWMFNKKHHHYMRKYSQQIAFIYRDRPISGFLEFQPCVSTN